MRILRYLGFLFVLSAIWMAIMELCAIAPVSAGVVTPIVGVLSLVTDPTRAWILSQHTMISVLVGCGVVAGAITYMAIPTVLYLRNQFWIEGRCYTVVYSETDLRYQILKELLRLWGLLIVSGLLFGAFIQTPGTFPNNALDSVVSLVNFQGGEKHYAELFRSGANTAFVLTFFYEMFGRTWLLRAFGRVLHKNLNVPKRAKDVAPMHSLDPSDPDMNNPIFLSNSAHRLYPWLMNGVGRFWKP